MSEEPQNLEKAYDSEESDSSEAYDSKEPRSLEEPGDLKELRTEHPGCDGEEATSAEEPENLADWISDAIDENRGWRTARITALAKAVNEKLPSIFKVLGALNIVVAITLIPGAAIIVAFFFGVLVLPNNQQVEGSTSNIVLLVILVVLLFALAVMLLVLGIRLLRGKRRAAALQARIMVAIEAISFVIGIMLFGINALFHGALILFVYLIIVSLLVDPTLAEERERNRLAQREETRKDVEEGVLGRDKTGKGYIHLDFFNMFWIFVLGSVVGLIFETIVCVPLNGGLENRTGMLWGPFSPIYGFGALLMTIALNRFYNKNILVIFVVSALIGAGFEYFVSWFLQLSFGIVAWDYSDSFANLDGRTDLLHAFCWGALGTLWVRYGLPRILAFINRIPWKWRYSITTICAVLMIFDGAMTLVSFDRWFERLSGEDAVSAVEVWIDERYDNEWMADRFQSVSINPENASRVSEGTAGMLDD